MGLPHSKKELNKYLKYIDFGLGNKKLFDKADEYERCFKFVYSWGAKPSDYVMVIEDWKEGMEYDDMLWDFRHALMGPDKNYENFVRIGTTLREKYGQRIPIFVDLMLEDKYVASAIITKEIFNLINVSDEDEY